MVYAHLQMAEDAAADKVGTEAREVSTLNDANLGEVFGVAAMPARLTLERGRWAEAAKWSRTLPPRPSDSGTRSPTSDRTA
jgi:hypothetical protein